MPTICGFGGNEVVDEALFHTQTARVEKLENLNPDVKLNPQDGNVNNSEVDTGVTAFHIMLTVTESRGH